MIRKIILSAISITLLLGFAACNKLDVIGDKSIDSFEQLINKNSEQITMDTQYLSWSLAAPDHTARFGWSTDFNKTQSFDAFIEFETQPFIDAGADLSNLQGGLFVIGDKIITGIDFSNESLSYENEVTPLESFRFLLEHSRETIQYHRAMDHYGVDLSNGNVFEWAKDMRTNDKDMVFVLNPQPFIDAGADVANIEGWEQTKIEVMDDNNKKIEVDRLIKAFRFD